MGQSETFWSQFVCFLVVTFLNIAGTKCGPEAYPTEHPQPSNLVHEQRGHDVARQHGQGAQEADEVDHVGIVVIAYVAEQTAFFVVQESAVDELTVNQAVLEKV